MDRDDQKSNKTAEEFLSRWSRRKQELRAKQMHPAPARTPDTDAALPSLPPVEQLDINSDFRGFFHPKVDETLRRAALKKLFGDPHFNVMDGLDVYIDDYSITEPLPAAMLGELKQAQKILAWASETDEEMAARRKLLDTESAHITGDALDSAPAVAALKPAPESAAVPESAVSEPAIAELTVSEPTVAELKDAAVQIPASRLSDDGSQNA